MHGRSFAATVDDGLAQWAVARRRMLRRNAGRTSLHAWRIASRRLLALEQLLAPPLPRTRKAALHSRLHHAFHASGELRDAQLAIRLLRQLAPRFPVATRLARHLHRGIARQRERVTRRVRALKPHAVGELVAGWRIAPTADGEQLAAARAIRRMARAQRMLAQLRRRYDAAQSIHRYRKQVKRVRYMLELCRAAGVPLRQTIPIRQLAVLQRRLGTLTDTRMLLKFMARFEHRHRDWRRDAVALRHYLQQRSR